jgi:hypothetical protein
MLAAAVPRLASGTPDVAATPWLVVPIAGYPAATKTSADATSQAFGRSSGRAPVCSSAKSFIVLISSHERIGVHGGDPRLATLDWAA